MKKFIITEEEKNRILGMHKSKNSELYLNEQTAGGLYTPELSKELHDLAFNAQSTWASLSPDKKAKWLAYEKIPEYYESQLGTSYPVELKLLLFKDLEGTIPSDNNQLAKLTEKDWGHVRNFIKWGHNNEK